MSARTLGLAVAVLAAVGAACQLLEGIQTRTSPPEPDASLADAFVPADAGPPPPDAAIEASCLTGQIPPPPITGATGGDITLVFAVQSILYALPDAGTLGYNLDCVDTCPGPPSCKSMGQNCDTAGGRDIAGNNLLTLVDTYDTATGQGSINQRIANGTYTILLVVTGWNGTPYDPLVSLAILFSSGIIADAEAGTTTPPRWDGTDVWEVDPRSVTSMMGLPDGGYLYVPGAVTPGAYINDNQLVATLPTLQFGIGIGVFDMTEIAFVAQLTPVVDLGGSQNDGYRLDGQLAGRMSVHSIFGLLAIFKDPTVLTHTASLCGSDPLFQTIRMNLCNSADVTSDPSLDNARPLAPCDALSLGLQVTAIKASAGYPYPGLTFTPGCDGAVDDCDGG